MIAQSYKNLRVPGTLQAPIPTRFFHAECRFGEASTSSTRREMGDEGGEPALTKTGEG